MNIYLLIIFQIIALIVDGYIAFSNNKKNVLLMTFVFNFLSLLLYFFIKDYSTVISYILIVTRSLVYIFQEKIKKYKFSFLIPITFMSLHIILGIKTITSIWGILPIIAPCIVCYLLWFVKKRQNMRLLQALSDLLWFIHNIYSGLYIISLSRIISIILGLLAYKKNYNNQNKKVQSI